MTQSTNQPATHSATQSAIGSDAQATACLDGQLTTYYDGGCPLCSKEIAHYRRVDRDHRVRWVDLIEAADELAAVGLDTHTAMRRLHVCDSDGRLLSGVPAFVAIWRRLPRYRVLARVVEALGLIRPLDWGYGRFADWRFRRRCADGACGVGARDSG